MRETTFHPKSADRNQGTNKQRPTATEFLLSDAGRKTAEKYLGRNFRAGNESLPGSHQAKELISFLFLFSLMNKVSTITRTHVCQHFIKSRSTWSTFEQISHRNNPSIIVIIIVGVAIFGRHGTGGQIISRT